MGPRPHLGLEETFRLEFETVSRFYHRKVLTLAIKAGKRFLRVRVGYVFLRA